MKNLTALLLLIAMATLSQAQSISSCPSDVLNNNLMTHNVEFSRSFYYMEHVLGKNRNLHPSQRTNDLYTIPVVVHVVHNGEAYGTGTNITDEQIFSAISSLNEDYRHMAGTNGYGSGADVNIEFCLASRNPSGQPTNGINRVNGSSVANYSTMGIESSSGGGASEVAVKSLSAWPRDLYMNIWVVNEIDNNDGGSGIQGYAYFPYNNIVDGIAILFNAFGTVGNLKSYTNMNRTLTHEVGHYLGLYHTFNSTTACGAETNCTTEGDRVCDTPPTIQAGSCSAPACGGTQQVQNYMDYTSQTCQDMFTDGQKLRMRTTLETQRTSILTSMGCMPVFQNDVGVTAIISPTGTNCSGGLEPQITLGNFGGNILTSVTINYNVDGVGNNSYNWSGSLASGTSTTVTLGTINPAGGAHTLYAWTSAPNGGTDQNTSNDQSNGAFSVTNGSPAQLDVVLDYYGVETSWIISDLNNNPLMNGGPYVNGQQGLHNVTPVCLAAGCYILTMNDVYGDGQGFTNGSFALTSSTGAVLASGAGNWGDMSVNNFCIVDTTPQGNAPVASFTVQDNSICRNIQNDYTSTSTNTPTTYSWTFEGGTPATSTTQNPQNVTYANAGTYDVTLTVTNAFGSDTFVCANCVTVNADPVVTLTPSNPACAGQNTGAVASSVAGGGSNTYAWSNGATSANIANLGAGSYSVTVTSSQGCIGQASTSLTMPTAMSITGTVQNATCAGSSNGSIQLNVTGGTGNKTYAWSNGTAVANASNLAAGVYSVSVSDQAGCSASQSFTVGSPAAIAISGNATNVHCFAGNDGAITVSASGGTGAKTYVWNTGATGSTINGLIAGTYTVVANDIAGCSSTATFNVTQPTALEINLAAFNIACGDAAGSAIISPSGGAPAYAVNWDNGSTAYESGSLDAGSYSVTVTDNNNCQITESFTIQQTENLNVVIDAQNISCFGAADGSVAAIISGGDQNYTFTWNNNATVLSQQNLLAGSYEIFVADGSGCTGSANAVILESTALVADIDANDITCFGSNNGSAAAIVIGGTAPFELLWSNGSSALQIDGQSAGNISLNVVDAHGCTAAASGNIEEPSMITANVIVTAQETCAGNNGSAEISVNGGIPSYGILWNNGSTTNYLNDAAAGVYSVTVTDANGCTLVAQAEILYNCQAVVPPTQLTSEYCNASDLRLDGTLACEIVAGADQYMWRVSTTTGTIIIDEYTADNLMPMTMIPDVDYSSTYIIGIKARVDGNWGPFGNYCSVVTEAIVLPTPGILDADCGVEINVWGASIHATEIADAVNYEWHISSNAYDWTAFTTTPSLEIVEEMLLAPGSAYQIEVRCSFGNDVYTNWSSACSFSVAIEMSNTNVLAQSIEFNVYPNPTHGENINLAWGSAMASNQNLTLAVMDGAGKCVEFVTLNTGVASNYNHVFANRLATGFYVIIVTQGDKRIEKKLIVN